MKKNYTKILLISAFVITILFTRFYNLDYTARFTQDESSDLARMHAYWQEKRITLVGPIAADNSKIFGSLTYYMQMPFAVLFNFEPVGPVVGTAFWGVLTVLLLSLLGFQLTRNNRDKNSTDNKKIKKTASLLTQIKQILRSVTYDSSFNLSLILFGFLILFWPPLLLTSRWAWNPHLIAFWISLALVVKQFEFKGKFFLIGLFLGLTIHHHYLAVFAVGTFCAIEFLDLLRKKQCFLAGELFFGFVFALLPFVIFDLRHPPGLFFSRYLQSDMPHLVETNNLLLNLHRNFLVSLNEVVHLWWLQLLFVLGFVKLVWLDFKIQRRNLIYLLPVFAQIFGCVAINDFPQRYFLPAVVFILVWLILPREKTAKKVSNFLMMLMVVSSLLQLPKVLTQPIMSPPMRVVTQAQHVIVQILAENPEIKNHNIAALTGNDLDSLGLKYRDLLSIRGVVFKAASEYDTTEHLFVVSDLDEDGVRQDQNVAMVYFKNEQLRGEYLLDEHPWRVFWFSY